MAMRELLATIRDRDRRDGEEGTAAGPAQQHPLADIHATRRQLGCDHRTARYNGLRGAGGHLHRGRQNAV